MQYERQSEGNEVKERFQTGLEVPAHLLAGGQFLQRTAPTPPPFFNLANATTNWNRGLIAGGRHCWRSKGCRPLSSRGLDQVEFVLTSVIACNKEEFREQAGPRHTVGANGCTNTARALCGGARRPRSLEAAPGLEQLLNFTADIVLLQEVRQQASAQAAVADQASALHLPDTGPGHRSAAQHSAAAVSAEVGFNLAPNQNRGVAAVDASWEAVLCLSGLLDSAGALLAGLEHSPSSLTCKAYGLGGPGDERRQPLKLLVFTLPLRCAQALIQPWPLRAWAAARVWAPATRGHTSLLSLSPGGAGALEGERRAVRHASRFPSRQHF